MRLWRRVVESRWAETLASNLGVPSGRRQQEALDMERLALSTQLWAARADAQAKGSAPPTQLDYQRIAMRVNAMSRSEHRQHVASVVNEQILGTATLLHELLQKAGDPAPAATRLEAARAALVEPQKGSSAQQQQQQQPQRESAQEPGSQEGAHQDLPQQRAAGGGQPQARAKLSAGEVSQLLKARLGFTLRVGPSTIQHPDAGQGLFVDGKAPAGAVVALVPGLCYPRTQLSRMPNYPQVSLGNDYLSSRYDMTIIDSQAWMQAAEAAARGEEVGSKMQEEGVAMWHRRYACWALGALETRHPLALGQFVNHPASGTHPNVLEVAWEVALDLSRPNSGWLRAYLPNAPALDLDMSQPAPTALLEYEAESSRAARGTERASGGPWAAVRGLALVATRQVQDGEELLQNYRLNPHAPRPAWYTSYDAEEEARRWAPLAFARLFQ